MEFVKMAKYWRTTFLGNDVSLGIHICWAGRIDFHIGRSMFSFGRVPIYKTRQGHVFAASNSYHIDKTKPFRAGVPE